MLNDFYKKSLKIYVVVRYAANDHLQTIYIK